MSAIEDIEQRLFGPYSVEIGPEGDRVASIRLSEFRAALAEAWEMGMDATVKATYDPQPLVNPFKEES